MTHYQKELEKQAEQAAQARQNRFRVFSKMVACGQVSLLNHNPAPIVNIAP